MATLGRVTPDQWMIHATGKPVGPEALLAATRKALGQVGSKLFMNPSGNAGVFIAMY